MAAFDLYADTAGQFRWRLKSANLQIMATSVEGSISELRTASTLSSATLQVLR